MFGYLFRIFDSIPQIKPLIIELVLWAENDLAGKSGADKKRAVISKVADIVFSLVKLPWYIRIFKNFIIVKPISYIVDLICSKLNLLSGGGFKDVKLNASQIQELSAVLDAPATLLASSAGKSIDERLDDLYAKYTGAGVGTAKNNHAPAAAPGSIDDEKLKLLYEKYGLKPDEVVEIMHGQIGSDVPAAADNTEMISANLSRREIACKDGCGFDVLDPIMANTFQALRDYIGKPIVITSGCRCAVYNKKVGGVPESGHCTGQALDFYVRGLDSFQLIAKIKDAYNAGLLPHLTYCYRLSGKSMVVHIGVDPKPRNSIWG